ncbi:MAG: alpha/beta fold hydrolase [Candidatus Binatia bacterium]
MLELPATPRSRLLDAGGCRVHVVEWGEPGHPPLLLLHGGMAHARWWDLVAARLADGLHVFAVDMPGHGDSPWLDPSSYAHVELPVVRALLATLAPGPWTLGGHSNGGLQAVVAATEDGAALARLVVVDIPLDPAGPRLVRSGMGFRRMPQPCWTTREEAVASFRLFPKDGGAPSEILRYVGEHSVREDGNGTWTSKFDWRYFRGRDPDAPNPYEAFPERLRRIPCPTLVMRGEHSSIQSAEDHAEMLARIPAATGAVIVGSGHNPHVEQPAETAHAIATFVLR